MRNKFDEQLELLNRELIEMGALCERSLEIIIEELLSGDLSRNEEVIRAEAVIDQKERDIEQLCLKLLLQQQPVARDLRQISAALKMITDMERIGDQAEDIAEIIPFLKGRTGKELVDFKLMAEAACKMVTDSIDAFVKKDLELAKSVYLQDDIVDGCFVRVKAKPLRAIWQAVLMVM